jgi:hypothetical protein
MLEGLRVLHLRRNDGAYVGHHCAKASVGEGAMSDCDSESYRLGRHEANCYTSAAAPKITTFFTSVQSLSMSCKVTSTSNTSFNRSFDIHPEYKICPT